ncbi:KRAB-A domain-containing protein 2 [Plakobranchus ocellatus]|uniref:KRAB-A domain-containing protein 2 n=1 Tax=Plakobranchus ocellatus TaxID=259542 RepID=A0AAV3YH73_9GAST|nr:KRAB-A domain-containing protein 2 [Plakobranchus ocellatus]
MTKDFVIRPMLTKELSTRDQVYLTDMQNMSSGSIKKWILVYQDHLTKFCIHRALTTKRAAEVALLSKAIADPSSLHKSLQN